MAIERDVVMRMKVRPEDGKALADMASRTEVISQAMGVAATQSQSLGLGTGRASTEMGRMTTAAMGGTAGLDRILSKVDQIAVATARAAERMRALQATAGAGGIPGGGLGGGMGPAMAAALGMSGPSPRGIPVATPVPPTLQTAGAGAGGISGILGSLGIAAIVTNLAHAIPAAISRAMQTTADGGISDLRQRDRSFSGRFSSIAEETARSVPLVGQGVGAYWDWMTESRPSEFGRLSSLFVNSASFGLFDLGLHQPGTSRRELEQSNRRLSRAEQAAARDRQVRGIAGSAYGQFADLQNQRRDMMGGAQIDAAATAFRFQDQMTALRRSQAEQQALSAFGTPIAGDLTYGGQAFGQAIGGLSAQIGQRSPMNSEAIFRNQQQMALQAANRRQAEDDFRNAGTTVARQRRLGGVDQSLTIDDIQRSARERMQQSAEQMNRLERERAALVAQSAQAEAERLTRFRDFANTAAQGYRSIAQQEGLRIQGLRQQFGLMNELERQRVTSVAQMVASGRGRELTREQMDIAQRNPDLFSNFLRDIGGERADQSGFQDLVRMLGVDRQQREATQRAGQLDQVRVNLDNRIAVELRQASVNDARVISEQVMPAIQQVLQQRDMAIREEFERRLTQLARSSASATAPP